jgi:hypothetical protein
MSQENLISKRDVLQGKLDVLRTRVDTWNCKVGKYVFELEARSSTVEEAADGTTSVEDKQA